MEDSNVPWDLLAHYLAGESTEGERAIVERWIAADQDNKALFERYRRSLEAVQRPIRATSELAAIKQTVMAGVVGSSVRYPTNNQASSLSVGNRGYFRQSLRRWASWQNVAWSIPILAVVVCIWPFMHRSTMPVVSSSRSYTTPPAQRASITLDDGTRVTLAPASRMMVDRRTVTLQGQALFTVTPDRAEPFLVHASGTTTRVLGTVFGIQSYPGDTTVLVAVAEGRVAVNKTVISNGELAMASGTHVAVHRDAEAVADWTAFAQGRLVITAQTLAHAAPQLSRWLGVDIHFTGAAGHRRMSITLQNQSVSEALEMIATLTNTTYTKRGRSVAFTPRN